MEFSECFSIKQQVLDAVRNKLIELGYLANDNSMKVRSEIYICIDLTVLGDYFIATFTINDDYSIQVKITVDNLYSALRCGLTVVTSDTKGIDFTDDAFDITTK